MRRFPLLLGVAAIHLAASPARATDASAAPIVGPAPAWVDQVAIPDPNPALKDRPVQPLLVVAEGRYPKDGRTEYHVESATLIQTPEGLTALGNIVLPWQPERADLVINRVRILRHGQEIDLLKNGQQFTVLRRENNLEAAMLDGVLTAVMQPEGLSVGDILDVSFTLRLKPQVIPFRPEDISTLFHNFPVRRLHYRQMWENGVAMRWAATDPMGKPKVSRTAWGTELVLDRTDAEGPDSPKDAPARFTQPARIELTGYSDWSEVGSLLAPSFAASAQLAPDSPLKAEIARIAAETQDPKQRAMSALRLVEDKVRYFALAMGDSGYVPAKADLTWSRKFGDCKGKTVLLMAILTGLGIDAEPVLVSSVNGDALSVRLPQVEPFNHVIVRARIGGNSYWLDGTRLGDRDIEALASSPFGWGLPLRSAAAKLEALPAAPPALPLLEMRLTYDASKGFFVPGPVTGEMIMRGDAAATMRLAMQQLGADEFRKQMRGQAPEKIKGEDVQVDFKSDEEHGVFTIIFTGKQRMDWSHAAGEEIGFRFDNDTIRWKPDFKRDDGPGKDLPFLLNYPVYMALTETVILPRDGAGFKLEGKSFDRIVAGTRIARTLSLDKGRAVARSLFERLKPEISAAEAHAAEPSLKEIAADAAFVRSPAGYTMSDPEKQALMARGASAADGPSDPDVLRAKVNLYEANGQFREALTEMDRLVAANPRDAWRLREKARLHAVLGEQDNALRALDRAIAVKPDDAGMIGFRGELLARFGRADAARKSYADAISAYDKAHPDPTDVSQLHQKTATLALSGQVDAAIAAATAALATHPANAELLIARCDARATGGVELDRALKDCSDALYYSDGNTEATIMKGMVELKMQRTADALADFEKAVSYEPRNARALYGRALARQRSGDKAGADADFASARRLGFDVAAEYEEIGLKS